MTDMPQHRAPCSRAALAGLVLFALIVCPACSTAGSADTSGVAPEPAAGAADIEQALDTSLEVLASAHSSDIDNALLSQVTAPWIGDFDDMVER